MDTWGDNRIFWDEALKLIARQISEQEYVMWFQQIEFTRSDHESLTVTVPSSFYRDQVKQRYLDLIERHLLELSGRHQQLVFEIRDNTAPDSNNAPTRSFSRTVPTESAREPKRGPLRGLSHDYTFEQFVVGDNNRFAANAALAIANNPGITYNPCLIYGGVGLGKTHLLQSIGNHAWRHGDKDRIVYVTAETFTNEFIRAIQDGKTHVFKNKYRRADVLLVDDIHFLQKKNETQEELFHTFNALFDAKKQMVFTSDRPVSEIKDITERLQNRFTRGLTVDLQSPKMETAVAILKKKTEMRGVCVPDDVISLICQKITTNVRDLEAALTRVIAYAELVNKEITIEVAQHQLKDFFASPLQHNVTVDIVQRTVADYYNVSPNELKSKKRNRQIIYPRHLAMYIAREVTEASMTDLGLEFGGRDHTTVMHAISKIESRIHTDPTLEDIIQNLISKIKDASSRA